MKQKNIFKQKPSVYVFGVLSCLCLAMFVYGLVSLCVYSQNGSYGRFLNIMQMIFSIACLLILIIYFSYMHFTKLQIKEPFHIYLMLFLFVFLGIYPCFDLFTSSAALGVFFAFLGFTLAIISISVYFQFSKNQNGSVRATPGFVLTFMAGFATLILALLETLVYLIMSASDSGALETVKDFVSNLAYGWIGVVAAGAITLISLLRSKIFVNMCLVRKLSD